MNVTVASAGLDDRYELGEVVGQGGAATVYRALDRQTGQPVAVKVYDAAVVAGDRPQHQAELAALVRLRHPGLVALYDSGFDDDRAYLVMQMIDGESLSQRLARGPLPVEAMVELGRQLAETLAYVHASGVIHRDVKPGNVLIDAESRCFLADFGVSRLVDATRCTVTGVAVGTPAFLAPEQVLGKRLGPPIDVYALGLVLLQAYTGAQEYPGGAIESAVARLHRSPQVPPTLPAKVRDLLRAMTADDPGARPDAAAVAAHLAADRNGDHAALRPRVLRVVQAVRRLRWSLASLAVASGAAMMGTLVSDAPPDRNLTRPSTSAGYWPPPVPLPTPAIAAADQLPRQAPPIALATGEAAPRAGFDQPTAGEPLRVPPAIPPRVFRTPPPADRERAENPAGPGGKSPPRETKSTDSKQGGAQPTGPDPGPAAGGSSRGSATTEPTATGKKNATKKAAKQAPKATRQAVQDDDDDDDDDNGGGEDD